MANFPYRESDSGDDPVASVSDCRALVNDGAGIYDYTVQGILAADALVTNEGDPVDMHGQKGVGLIIEADQSVTVTLYGMEKVDGTLYGPYRLYTDDPDGSVQGQEITFTFTPQTAGVADTYMRFFHNVTAPYVAVRIQNGASANNLYVRVY
jgi:hypothetical protein